MFAWEVICVISFEQFLMVEGIPIYMQILLYIKRGIVAGKIPHGEELPSRRVLSSLLGVNPNTVQKAYKLLEDEGLIRSQTGAASTMQLDENKIETVRRELLESDTRNVIRAMRQMGVTQEQAIRLIDRFWNEVES